MRGAKARYRDPESSLQCQKRKYQENSEQVKKNMKKRNTRKILSQKKYEKKKKYRENSEQKREYEKKQLCRQFPTKKKI